MTTEKVSLKSEKKLNKNGDTRGIHPNSLKNLKPGTGRPPKDQSIIDLIRSKLSDKCEYDTKGRTWLEALADAELRMSLTDNVARKNLLDRLLGKAPEQIDITTQGQSIKPEYKELPADRVAKAIEHITQAGVLTISPN